MSQWTEKRNEIRIALKNTNAKSHSKGDLVDLTAALINSPEEEIPVYVKDDTAVEGYAAVMTSPAKDLRHQMKRIVMDVYDIDKAEAGKIDNVELPKAFADAVMAVSLHSMKAYMEDGRKLVLPVTAPNDARMGISIDTKPERRSESVKFIDKPDGGVEKVTTGEFVVTKEHNAINSHNKVPDWLKTRE